jgi:hypothetical protein
LQKYKVVSICLLSLTHFFAPKRGQLGTLKTRNGLERDFPDKKEFWENFHNHQGQQNVPSGKC